MHISNHPTMRYPRPGNIRPISAIARIWSTMRKKIAIAAVRGIF